MTGVVRLLDIDTSNHQMIEASSDVKADGYGICRVGDMDNAISPILGDKITTGSSTVFANGKAVAMIYSKDTNNDIKISGSSDVIVN